MGCKSQLPPNAACIHDLAGVIVEKVYNHVQEFDLAQIPATMLFVCHNINVIYLCAKV
jgi:hypothetical protein